MVSEGSSVMEASREVDRCGGQQNWESLMTMVWAIDSIEQEQSKRSDPSGELRRLCEMLEGLGRSAKMDGLTGVGSSRRSGDMVEVLVEKPQ